MATVAATAGFLSRASEAERLPNIIDLLTALAPRAGRDRIPGPARRRPDRVRRDRGHDWFGLAPRKALGSALDACFRPNRIIIKGSRRFRFALRISFRPVIIRARSLIMPASLPAGSTSAIICPLLVAGPKSFGAKGMIPQGTRSTALAKSLTLISGRFGIPTQFIMSFGCSSCARAERSISSMFFVLRRFA